MDITDYTIVKRTFEALKFPKGSEERTKLNCDSVTSEYNKSIKYFITRKGITVHECKSKKEVDSAIEIFLKYGDGYNWL